MVLISWYTSFAQLMPGPVLCLFRQSSSYSARGAGIQGDCPSDGQDLALKPTMGWDPKVLPQELDLLGISLSQGVGCLLPFYLPAPPSSDPALRKQDLAMVAVMKLSQLCLSAPWVLTSLFSDLALTGLTRVILAQPVMNQVLRPLCNIFPHLGCSGRGRKPPTTTIVCLGFHR